MKTKNPEHCPPETLVDLAEGAPVEAARVQHLAACSRCAEQVAGLRATLAAAREVDVREPGERYWEDFPSRLRGRIAREERETARWQRRLLPVAAAAAVAVAAWLARDLMRTPEPAPASSPLEALLPLAEEDVEFQFLISVAELVDPEEELDEVGAGLSPTLDLSSLTAEEENELRERIEQALKAGGDAKS